MRSAPYYPVQQLTWPWRGIRPERTVTEAGKADREAQNTVAPLSRVERHGVRDSAGMGNVESASPLHRPLALGNVSARSST